MTYLYHIVPPRVEGEFLLPLNKLKETQPEIYQQHSNKYSGREELMERIIPHLGVSWYDVLQLSPVHPEKLRDAMVERGFGWRPMLAFEVDPRQAGMTVDNTVIYHHLPKERGDFELRESEFEPFSLDALARVCDVPQVTKDHFAASQQTKTAPMLFLWVPHVLFAGQISVSQLSIIEIA